MGRRAWPTLRPVAGLELGFGELDGAVALAPPDLGDDFVGHVRWLLLDAEFERIHRPHVFLAQFK